MPVVGMHKEGRIYGKRLPYNQLLEVQFMTHDDYFITRFIVPYQTDCGFVTFGTPELLSAHYYAEDDDEFRENKNYPDLSEIVDSFQYELTLLANGY